MLLMFPKMHSFRIILHGPTTFKGLGIFSSLGQSSGLDTEGGKRFVGDKALTARQHCGYKGKRERVLRRPGQPQCRFFLSPVVRVHRFLAGQTMAQCRGWISLPYSLHFWVWHQPTVLFFSKHQAFYDLLASSLLFCCFHMSIRPWPDIFVKEFLLLEIHVY